METATQLRDSVLKQTGGRRGPFATSWCDGSLCTQHGLWWAAVCLCQSAKPLRYVIHLDAAVTLKAAEPNGLVSLHIQEEEGSLLFSFPGAFGLRWGPVTQCLVLQSFFVAVRHQVESFPKDLKTVLDIAPLICQLRRQLPLIPGHCRTECPKVQQLSCYFKNPLAQLPISPPIPSKIQPWFFWKSPCGIVIPCRHPPPWSPVPIFERRFADFPPNQNLLACGWKTLPGI